MRILYIVHSIPEFDKSGTPYAAWRAAVIAKKRFGVEVGFLIGSPDNQLHKAYVEDIPVYMVPKIGLYANFFEDSRLDRREYLGWVDAAFRDFQPTLLHVYNFVGLSYQILRLKEKYPSLKILRTITHTEDICFCIDPLFIGGNGQVECCSGPFPIEKCARHFQLSTGRNVNDMTQRIEQHYQQLNDYYHRYVDGVVFSGSAFQDFISKIFLLPPKRWQVPYGIAPLETVLSEKNDCSDPGQPIRLTFFGGVGPRKGLGLLLRLIRQHPELLASFHLQVVGSLAQSWLNQELHAVQAMYPAQITILGRLSDEAIDQVMRESDLAVLPTYFETYNITLRELLLRGTPVIVSDTYGTEIISPDVNGYIFPRGDLSVLQEILRQLSHDRALLRRLQQGALATPIDSIEQECRKLVAVYQALSGGEEEQAL